MIYRDMSVSDKFYSEYSEIRTNLKYQFIRTKEMYDEIRKVRKNFEAGIRRN